ncbi:MAG: ABC transporter substrate-binding protein, partial [Firmicutes bacterium]|nr:ABC transporter substrate-binding protein [Bacillota bacterium]
MRKGAWILVLLFMVLLGWGAVNAQEPISIALINSVTGEKALPGVYKTSAIQMAIEEWNEKGGVLGRPVRLHIEDDTGTTSGAVTAFKRVLSEIKPVAVFGPIYSVMELAMVPWMLQGQVPVIAGATNVKLTHQNNPWYFRIRSNDGVDTKLAAKFAVVELGAKKIGLLHDSDEFGTGGARMVAAEIPAFGGEVVASHAYHGGDKDFSSQLLDFQRKGVDVIIAWGHPVEAGLVYRQKASMGIDIPIVGSPSWGTPVAIDLSEGGADGNFTIVDYISTDPDPIVKEFDKKFREKFNLESEYFGASYYDGVNILFSAIERAGSLEPEAIREALLTTRDFRGVVGCYN